ncbi:hypothetical protein [Pseudomonas brassicacearum]|uniref:Uncharacterized protein n=1 Tax=Pseudomonas brassicacearum TaxID=930166 RepID=A0A423H207_9PSED|nr:hypothetical protein [Pseudomonas brassicacearum]RON06223.1 hypothetical protein BK658_00080 [Pseudomonas brassicacearum]
MNPIKVYEPKIQVRLIKTIKRKTVNGTEPTSERFQGAQGALNLNKWLGDGSSINTMKSVNEPAGGFSITVPDQPTDSGGLDSLYGVIEPMDMIEIRIRHGAPTGADSRPPIVMRGFVSSVSRDETMGPDGRPARSVTIQGHDYGKIWQMIQIFYGPSYIIGEDILSAFKLMDLFGAGASNALSNVDFLKLGVQMVNEYLAKLLPKGAEFPQITVRSENVIEAAVGITAIQSAEGTIHELMTRYLDVGPFNELFLTEDDDGVYAVYRQNPVLSLSGAPLYPKVTTAPYGGNLNVDAGQLTIIDLSEDDIFSIKVQRTDANVANYYWVSAPAFSLNSDVLMRQMGATDSQEAKTVDLGSYGNSNPGLYGHRLMRIETKLGGPSVTNVKSGLTEQEQEARDANIFDWIKDRRGFLVAQNKDNSILEIGTLQIRGNEKIRAGNYIRVRRGTTASLYYVTSVAHRFVPFSGFTTTLTVARGQGFADRIRMGGGVDSPYLAELANPRH